MGFASNRGKNTYTFSNMEYGEKFQISLERIALPSAKYFWPVNFFSHKGLPQDTINYFRGSSIGNI
jgi:hypothetical protein